MTKYRPDGWIVIRLDEGKENVWYRIFSTWRGGYLDGDRWRLSSGSQEAPIEESAILIWKQASGTVYEIEKTGAGGTTFYTHGVAKGIIEDLEKSGCNVEIVKVLDESMNLLPVEQWTGKQQEN